MISCIDNKWPGMMSNLQTSTSVLLRADNLTLPLDEPGFGQQARGFYLDLDPHEQSRYLLFEKFKMSLAGNLDRRPKVKVLWLT